MLILLRRVLDSDKLGSIFAKFLSPEEPNPDLETYYSADYNGVSLLLKAEKKSDKYVGTYLGKKRATNVEIE